jgi:hypothetical protein
MLAVVCDVMSLPNVAAAAASTLPPAAAAAVVLVDVGPVPAPAH